MNTTEQQIQEILDELNSSCEGYQIDEAYIPEGAMSVATARLVSLIAAERETLELPEQVIRKLGRYLDTGCSLKVVTEDFNGKPVQRWIANDNLVLWTAEEQEKK